MRPLWTILPTRVMSATTIHSLKGAADSSFTRYTFCGILVVIFGIIAVAGGISGIKRKNFALAVAGSVMGMIGGGLYGFCLGLGALIIFGLSNQDLTS